MIQIMKNFQFVWPYWGPLNKCVHLQGNLIAKWVHRTTHTYQPNVCEYHYPQGTIVSCLWTCIPCFISACNIGSFFEDWYVFFYILILDFCICFRYKMINNLGMGQLNKNVLPCTNLALNFMPFNDRNI